MAARVKADAPIAGELEGRLLHQIEVLGYCEQTHAADVVSLCKEAVPVFADALTALASLQAQCGRLQAVVDAARGLSRGTDWNNGTHAKKHGCRRKLLDALAALNPEQGRKHGD